jgi:hypothetical protein
MEPIKPPRTMRVFQLVRQTGLNFSTVGGSSGVSLGLGFYPTLQEAEHNRTIEVLKDTTAGTKPRFHVFELEVPNPAYQE